MELEIARTEPCKLRKKLLDKFRCAFKVAIEESIIVNKEKGFIIKEVYEQGKIELHRNGIRTGTKRKIKLDYSTPLIGHEIVGHFHSHMWSRHLRRLRPSYADIANIIEENIDYTCIGAKSEKSGEYGLRVFTRPNDAQLVKIHKRTIHKMYQYNFEYSPPDKLKPHFLNANPSEIKELLARERVGRHSMLEELDINNEDKIHNFYKDKLMHSFGYGGNRCRKVVFR